MSVRVSGGAGLPRVPGRAPAGPRLGRLGREWIFNVASARAGPREPPNPGPAAAGAAR